MYLGTESVLIFKLSAPFSKELDAEGESQLTLIGDKGLLNLPGNTEYKQHTQSVYSGFCLDVLTGLTGADNIDSSSAKCPLIVLLVELH